LLTVFPRGAYTKQSYRIQHIKIYKTSWKVSLFWSSQTVTWALTDLSANISVAWSKEERRSYAFHLKTGVHTNGHLNQNNT
ncbi:MAG: hypothetical protein GX799_06135, partial [Crenarchaeota archaeon]|nr:hypothetical protein [Thermoproteota archaeon]